MRCTSLSLAALLLLAAGPSAEAQWVREAPARARPSSGVCEAGSAVGTLDVLGVRTELGNQGLWTGASGGTFEVPMGWDTDAIWSSDLWIGGTRDGLPHFAGARRGGGASPRLAPGPLGPDGQPAAALCAAHDRIWIVGTADLDAFAATGTPSEDLASWPVGSGAPFYLDADGDHRQGAHEPTVALRPGDARYDPARAIDLVGGERPVVHGAQTAWWVMNDLGTGGGWRGAPAIGVEVRVTAWALGDRDRPALLESMFFRYDVLNRADAALADAYLGFETEADVGDYRDNYLHSDTTRSMVVVYNADDHDAALSVPPALGFDFLSGGYGAIRPGGRQGANAIAQSGADAYHYLRALWLDGTHMSEGGTGFRYGEGEPVRWLFPGDPVAGAYWSEEDLDGAGHQQRPGGWFHITSAALGDLAPGAEATVDLGVLFAWGTDRLDSVVELRAVSDAAQAAYADRSLFGTVEEQAPSTPPAVAPTLLGPDDGAVSSDAPIVLSWASTDGADRYRVQFGSSPAFEDPREIGTPGTSVTVAPESLLRNRTAPFYWRVVPTREGLAGTPSPARRLTAYRYLPGAPTLSDGSAAFVEVVGPGGADPCGAAAVSTVGCDEVAGNGIDESLNSTGDYRGTDWSGGTVASIGEITPNEIEIRFTAEGSIAFDFGPGSLSRVPFEVWNVGPVAPGEPNDPSDDVQLVVLLGRPDASCQFGYTTPADGDTGARTPGIYALPPVEGYAAYAAEAEAAVEADPAGCPTGTAVAAAFAQIDVYSSFMPDGYVLEQASATPIAGLEGTVIRFYTATPFPVAEEAAPVAGPLALAVFPNPAVGAATVAFETAAAGPVRLRVVDVLGREVAVVADGPQTAGPHRATLATAALAPGVYLVVLDTAGARTVRTLTVVR